MMLENWITTCKRIKLDPYITPYTKLTTNESKEDLTTRLKQLKNSEEKIEQKLHDIGLVTEKTHKIWLHENLTFCVQTDTVK